MKIITGIMVLALCCGLALGGLVTGCSVAQKMVTTACGWMDEYIAKADAQVVKIQADYDTYVAVITGLIPVSSEVMVAAKAWVAAADIALEDPGGRPERHLHGIDRYHPGFTNSSDFPAETGAAPRSAPAAQSQEAS